MKKELGQQEVEIAKLQKENATLKSTNREYAIALLDLMITVDNIFNRIEVLKKETMEKIKK